MGKTPTAVIFDMDDVLCRYHFDERLARLSEMTGVATEIIGEVIWKQGFDEEADAGRYTADEYHRLFCERIGAALRPKRSMHVSKKSQRKSRRRSRAQRYRAGLQRRSRST